MLLTNLAATLVLTLHVLLLFAAVDALDEKLSYLLTFDSCWLLG